MAIAGKAPVSLGKTAMTNLLAQTGGAAIGCGFTSRLRRGKPATHALIERRWGGLARRCITALASALVTGAAATAVAASGAESHVHSGNTLGLPSDPALSHGNPHLVALGKALFQDRKLSADGSVSCATCHQSESAHTDGRSVSEGTSGRQGLRNTPSILNVAYLDSLFWDGRRTTLEDQAADPFTDHSEHGLRSRDALLALIRARPEYQQKFGEAFGIAPDAISVDHVTRAIAAFERTLVVGNSPFDRYYYGRDKTALSESAVRGLSLFAGRADCTRCHTIGRESSLFTDQQFHRVGIGFSRIQPRLAAIVKAAIVGERGSESVASVSRADVAELGRFNVTKKIEDIGKFRTPSLRNVAVTAPYMHDGSVPTLEAAVELEIYYRSLESGRPLVLTPKERADLVAFLEALTSPQFAGRQREASELREVRASRLQAGIRPSAR